MRLTNYLKTYEAYEFYESVHEIGNEDNIGSSFNLKIGISKMEDESKKYINFLEGCQCKNTVTLNAFYDYLDQA